MSLIKNILVNKYYMDLTLIKYILCIKNIFIYIYI